KTRVSARPACPFVVTHSGAGMSLTGTFAACGTMSVGTRLAMLCPLLQFHRATHAVLDMPVRVDDVEVVHATTPRGRCRCTSARQRQQYVVRPEIPARIT